MVNRLFGICYQLMQRDKIPAKELAERYEVSMRTIYRDVEILSMAGVPIYASKGRSGGISLLQREGICHETSLFCFFTIRALACEPYGLRRRGELFV